MAAADHLVAAASRHDQGVNFVLLGLGLLGIAAFGYFFLGRGVPQNYRGQAGGFAFWLCVALGPAAALYGLYLLA